MSNITVELSTPTVGMITISILFSLISILFSILTVLPREESGISEGFVYWNDIKKYNDQNTYAEAITELDGDTPLNEISHDIYNLSSVAQEKYKYLRCSIIFSIGFLLFGSVSAISFVICS
ncbi:Pycsar system effector family protein [Halorubrum sp. DTA46]|uniref:Pycsar system effector family protein n=1 Tax=Halorubrum sp. DTA46 TaxID=3402162 RepID=UPI003AB02217